MGDNLITNTNVFDFCGCDDDQRTTQASFITRLIAETQADLETRLRRDLNSVSFTAVKFHDGRNCEITNGNKLRFTGKYRDTYSITAITEEGTALDQSTTYDDGNDWIYEPSTGIIEKITGNWSISKYAIVITGAYGYLNSDNKKRADIQKVLTEMVAAKSGLWKIITATPDGSVTETKTTISKDAQNIFLSHKNYTL